MKIFKDKKTFFIVVLVFVVLMIGYVFFRNRTKNYNHLKIDKSKYLVYTASQEPSGSYYQYRPYVNLKGEVGTLVNNDIASFFQNFTNENICITYESDLNGKVLSLVLKVEDHSYAESATILYFRSYNIHLEQQQLLPAETLFQYFGTTSSEVESILNGRMGEYYNQLTNDGVIDSSTCNYTCFLESRNFESGLQDVSFFVRDGKLIAFKPYTFISVDSHEETVIHDFEIAS